MARKNGLPIAAEQSWQGFKLRHIFKGHQEAITALAWTPDGNHLISTSFDQTVKIWGMKEAAELQTVSHSGWINDVAVAPNGKRFVTASSDYTLKVWDLPDCRLIHT